MKRLALLLGSLLVVTAAASAKEVVPAPVVVEEAPVQVVEKEVIVYRDKEEGFRPNGYVSLEYKYMHDTEGNEKNGDNEWNTDNKYSRLQLMGKINMTENQTFDYRIRSYASLFEDDVNNQTSVGNGTETRLRYYYNAGKLGDTNIAVTPFLQYKKRTSDRQELRADLRFDFADYLFNNDFIKTTKAEVGPTYMYEWSSGNDSDYTNKVGIYFDFYNELPYGFALEVKSDDDPSYYNMYGAEGKDDNFLATLGVYLYHNANLYTNGKYSLDWYFEGGYDQYKWSSRDIADNTDSNRSYSLYANPNLIFSYAATDFVSVYTQLGAEYRDWTTTVESSAQDWRWQPFVAVGFKTTF